jgi:hypothetical protein
MANENTGGAIIADRFKLDIDPNAGKAKAPAGGAVIGALICSIIALALVATTATLMYMNWELIKNA